MLGYDVILVLEREVDDQIAVSLIDSTLPEIDPATTKTWLPRPSSTKADAADAPPTGQSLLDPAWISHHQPDSGRKDLERKLVQRILDKLAGMAGQASDVDELGHYLFRRVFKDGVAEALKRTRGLHARLLDRHKDPDRLRLRLCVRGADSDLLRYPWEYLRDGKGYLLKDKRLTVVRSLREASNEPPDRANSPEHVFLWASPTLNSIPDTLIQSWKQNLDEHFSHCFEVANSSKENLSTTLQRGVSGLILLAHGQRAASGVELLLEKAGTGEEYPLQASDLKELIETAASPPVWAVLSTCWSGATGAGSLDGLGQQVLEAGVDSVICMQFPIRPEYSAHLSRELPRNLATVALQNLSVALEESRFQTGAVATEWGSPVTFDNRPGFSGQKPEGAKFGWSGGKCRTLLPETEDANSLERALIVAIRSPRVSKEGRAGQVRILLHELTRIRECRAAFTSNERERLPRDVTKACRILEEAGAHWYDPVLLLNRRGLANVLADWDQAIATEPFGVACRKVLGRHALAESALDALQGALRKLEYSAVVNCHELLLHAVSRNDPTA